jgi:hypothetical protein
MMYAGDLDSQGEKLYRIRSLSLTPEFAGADMTGYLLFYMGNTAAHERLRPAHNGYEALDSCLAILSEMVRQWVMYYGTASVGRAHAHACFCGLPGLFR